MGGGGGGSSHSSFTREVTKKGIGVSNGCDMNFDTDLQKIQPALANHTVGDQLAIELDKKETIVVKSSHGICGNITSHEAIPLIDCIKKGNRYKATILKKTSNSCRVNVSKLK